MNPDHDAVSRTERNSSFPHSLIPVLPLLTVCSTQAEVKHVSRVVLPAELTELIILTPTPLQSRAGERLFPLSDVFQADEYSDARCFASRGMIRLPALFRTLETSKDRTTHTGRAAGTAPGEENSGPEKRGMRERQSPPRIRISRARAGMHCRVIPRTGGFPHLPPLLTEEHAYLRPLLPSQRCCFFCFFFFFLFFPSLSGQCEGGERAHGTRKLVRRRKLGRARYIYAYRIYRFQNNIGCPCSCRFIILKEYMYYQSGNMTRWSYISWPAWSCPPRRSDVGVISYKSVKHWSRKPCFSYRYLITFVSCSGHVVALHRARQIDLQLQVQYTPRTLYTCK